MKQQRGCDGNEWNLTGAAAAGRGQQRHEQTVAEAAVVVVAG